MNAASLLPSDNKTPSAAMLPTMRRCLVTGEVKDKEVLVRFVVGPENRLVPDVAGKLPGRGLWVSSCREILNEARRKNLFSKAAKQKISCPEDLGDQLDKLLRQRCLDLLGLARGAGAVVIGQPQVEQALQKNGLAAVWLADDAGQDVRKKLAHAPLVFSGFSREELGTALGHAFLVAVGLRDHSLTKKMMMEWTRWQGVRASETILTEPLLGREST